MFDFLTQLSPSFLLLFKITVVLLLGWAFHFALLKFNPRWRVFLWRAIIVSLLVLPLAGFLLPKVDVELPARSPVFISHSTSGFSGNPTMSLPESPDFEKVPSNEVKTHYVFKRNNKFDFFKLVKRNFNLLLFLPWVTGFSVLLFRFYFSFLKLRYFSATVKPAPQNLLETIKQISLKLKIKKPTEVKVTKKLCSPFLTGIFKPAIIIPHWMLEEKYSDDLPSILAHELTHIKSNDLFWNLLSKIISTILWFHPLIWKMNSTHNSATEQVCDAVASDFSKEKASYSKTLAKAALEITEKNSLQYGIPMIGNSQIAKRLRHLAKGIKATNLKKKKVALSFILCSVFVFTLGCMKFVFSEPDKNNLKYPPTEVSTKIEKSILVSYLEAYEDSIKNISAEVVGKRSLGKFIPFVEINEYKTIWDPNYGILVHNKKFQKLTWNKELKSKEEWLYNWEGEYKKNTFDPKSNKWTFSSGLGDNWKISQRNPVRINVFNNTLVSYAIGSSVIRKTGWGMREKTSIYSSFFSDVVKMDQAELISTSPPHWLLPFDSFLFLNPLECGNSPVCSQHNFCLDRNGLSNHK